MKLQALVLTAAVLLAGCGVAPVTPNTVRTGVQVAEGATTFSNLSEVKVVKGGPSDWYTKTRSHVAAKTGTRGTLWILDNPKGFEVLHNTQEVTNATKLGQVAVALEKLAAQSDDQAYAAELKRFAQGVRGLIKR